MIELSELRIFKAVVDEGGVTRAADKLHRVQSNVTTRIRQLEDKLGTALFIREGRRLRLSPSGQVLYGYADDLLRLAGEAEAALLDSSPRGPFRLGSMESTAGVRLPGLLTRYLQLYPDVELQLTTGNPQHLAAALLAGEIEAAFFAEPVAEGPFESVPAFTEQLVVATARGHPPITDKTLPDRIIVFENGCPHRRQIEHWYTDSGAAPLKTIQISSYHAMLGSVAVGMGAALLPRSVLNSFPDAHQLAVHPLPEGRNRLLTRLVWPRGAKSAKVAALAEMIPKDAAAPLD